MDPLDSSEEERACFIRSFTKSDDIIERLAFKFFEGFASGPAVIDADFGQDLERGRVRRFGGRAGGIRFETIPEIVIDQSLRPGPIS